MEATGKVTRVAHELKWDRVREEEEHMEPRERGGMRKPSHHAVHLADRGAGLASRRRPRDRRHSCFSGDGSALALS